MRPLPPLVWVASEPPSWAVGACVVGPPHPIPPRGSEHPDCLGIGCSREAQGFLEEANWVLSVVGNFSRLGRKGMGIWGGE